MLKYSWNSIGYSLIMVTDLIMAGNLINAYVPPGVLLALMLCLEFVFSFFFFFQVLNPRTVNTSNPLYRLGLDKNNVG